MWRPTTADRWAVSFRLTISAFQFTITVFKAYNFDCDQVGCLFR